MAANVNIVINARDRASGVFRKVRNAFGEIIQVAVGIRLSQTLQRMGEAVRDFATNSVDAAADFQQFQIGVETLIAREQMLKNYGDETFRFGDAMAYASSVAQDYIADLQNIALLSPYQFSDVQKAYKQAMAFGFGAEEAIKFVDATLDVAAGVGASNAQLDRMAYNLAQIRLQGKVTKLDIRQLALAGFDLRSVLTYVGDQMGIEIETYEDFNKAIENGTITWEDFTLGYAAYADEYFGGASERMAKTLFGLRNTFKDFFMVVMPQILGPALESFSDFAGEVIDKLIELRDSGALEEWGTKLKENFDTKIKPVLDYLLMGKLDPNNKIVMLLQFFKTMHRFGTEISLRAWKEELEALFSIDLDPLIRFIDKGKDLIEALKSGEGLFSDTVLGNLGMMFGLDENTLPDLLDKAKKAIQPFVDWFVERWQEMKPAIDAIWEGLKNNLGPVLAIIGLVIGWIVTELVPILISVFEEFTTMLGERGPALESFFIGLRNIGMIVAGVLAGAWMILKPVLIAVLPYLFGAIGALMDFVGFLIGGDLKSAGQALLDFFGNLAAGIFSGLRGLIKGLVELIWRIITGEEFDWEKFRETFDQLRAIIAFKLAEAGEAIRYFFSKENWDENIGPAIDDWFLKASEVGQNLMESIGRGFKNALSNVKAWINDGIQGIIDWVKKILDMGSPSKVFEELGVQSMEGFVKGLQPDGMISAGIDYGVVPALQGAGAGGRAVVINNHYHGLTLNDRLEAETILRPIVQRITR